MSEQPSSLDPPAPQGPGPAGPDGAAAQAALRLSVVIPCYNALSTIGELLAGLTSQSLPRESYEIIVVDNGSTDGSADVVAACPGVILLRQENLGPGAARNEGMRQARGELVLFLDSDLAVAHDLLEKHVSFHRDHPAVAATGGSVRPAANYRLFSWSMVDHLCSWFNAHGGVRHKAPPEYLPSLNFCVNKALIEQHSIAWLDGLKQTGEDVVFCHDLRQNNLPLAFVPEAVVFHRDRDTMRGYLRHMYRWGQHAPSVRGRIPKLKFGFLFPRRRWKLAMTLPLIVAGYSALVYLAWLRERPLAATAALGQIVLGRIAYAAGVWNATGRV